jgi:hypothetical protein
MVLVNLGVVQLCQADHLKGFRRSNIQSHLVLRECSSALRQVPTQKQYSSNVVPFFRVYGVLARTGVWAPLYSVQCIETHVCLDMPWKKILYSSITPKSRVEEGEVEEE